VVVLLVVVLIVVVLLVRVLLGLLLAYLGYLSTERMSKAIGAFTASFNC
jgi:hypothetical protein